jgi:hypothetical protein
LGFFEWFFIANPNIKPKKKGDYEASCFAELDNLSGGLQVLVLELERTSWSSKIAIFSLRKFL